MTCFAPEFEEHFVIGGAGKMEKLVDYYAVLNVSQSAEPEVIRAAYKTLALKYHPDTWTGDEPISDRRIQEINEAHEVLSNPERRRDYDLKMEKAINDGVYFNDETIKNVLLWLAPLILQMGQKATRLKLNKESETAILAAAERLIHMGHKEAAIHINRALVALRSNASPDIIYQRIKERLSFKRDGSKK